MSRPTEYTKDICVTFLNCKLYKNKNGKESLKLLTLANQPSFLKLFCFCYLGDILNKKIQTNNGHNTVNLPVCSSLTGFVMAEPVRAASVAEWEVRKRDMRLISSSFRHFDDSPSFRDKITRSRTALATHSPDSAWGKDKQELFFMPLITVWDLMGNTFSLYSIYTILYRNILICPLLALNINEDSLTTQMDDK